MLHEVDERIKKLKDADEVLKVLLQLLEYDTSSNFRYTQNDKDYDAEYVVEIENKKYTLIGVRVLRDYDENYRDNGRIDICCYLSQLEDDYIAFECKRFLKEDIIPSYIRDAYYGEGIKRFEDNIYADKVDFGGMIAFLEEGDYQKLWQRLVQELPRYTSDGNVCDISNTYGYQYILQTRHDRKSNGDIVLIHILMDFT